MRHRTAEEVREAFARLRLDTDPRGHGLLDELMHACLVDNSLMALQDHIERVQERIMNPHIRPLADVIPFPGHSVKAGGAA